MTTDAKSGAIHTNADGKGVRSESGSWKSDLLWLIPSLALLIHPLSIFILFGIAMSQQPFSQMPFYLKTAAAFGYFGFYAPPLAALVLLISVKYWVSRRLYLAPLCLFLACSAFSIFPVIVIQKNVNSYLTERQYVKFAQAVQNRDKAKALSLANGIGGFKGVPYNPGSKYICLGIAYELNGEYEKSLRQYQIIDVGAYSFCARVYYKQERYADAFNAYCQLAELAICQYENAVKLYSVTPEQAKAACRGLIKRRVLFFNEDQNSPVFNGYGSFLDWLNRQYEQTEEPEKYERAVQFLRDAASAETSGPVRQSKTPEAKDKSEADRAFYLRDDERFQNLWREINP